MGTQHFGHVILVGLREIECVMHGPRRMGFGNVERGEIVPVVFDLRAGFNGETEVGKNFCQFVHDL